MKAIAIAAMMALAGCEAARHVAPQTTTGFEQNGAVGALEGASGAAVDSCLLLDAIGPAVDGVALDTGTGAAIGAARAGRRQACAVAAAVHALGAIDGAVSVHRRGAAGAAPAE